MKSEERRTKNEERRTKNEKSPPRANGLSRRCPVPVRTEKHNIPKLK